MRLRRQCSLQDPKQTLTTDIWRIPKVDAPQIQIQQNSGEQKELAALRFNARNGATALLHNTRQTPEG
jgi:hypothetical protein